MPLRTRKREHIRRRHARDLTTRNHFATHQGMFTYASMPGRTRRPDRDVRNGHPNCKALDHAHLRKHGLGMRSANALLAHRTTQLLQEAHLGAPSKNRLAKCTRKRTNTMHQIQTKQQSPRPRSLTQACPWDALGMWNSNPPSSGALHPCKRADCGDTECPQSQAATSSPNGTRKATWRGHRRQRVRNGAAVSFRHGGGALHSSSQTRMGTPNALNVKPPAQG